MFALRNQPSSHHMIQVFGNCLQLRGWLVSHRAPPEENRDGLYRMIVRLGLTDSSE